MTDTIVIKIRIPEWVPTQVRKKMKSEIEDSIGEIIAESWDEYTPEIERSSC
jgi:hypothetical protein